MSGARKPGCAGSSGAPAAAAIGGRVNAAPSHCFPRPRDPRKSASTKINKKTGHRIRYLKVDAETGEEVPNEDIIKGYQVDKDRYLEVTKDELENIALESTRTIEIDEFVPRRRSTISIWCGPTISCQTARSATTPSQ